LHPFLPLFSCGLKGPTREKEKRQLDESLAVAAGAISPQVRRLELEEVSYTLDGMGDWPFLYSAIRLTARCNPLAAAYAGV